MSDGSDFSISHEGIIKSVDVNSATVVLTSATACSGCHAESACGMSGSVKKEVTVTGIYDVRPGAKVTVMMTQSQGSLALILAYVLPLVLFILCLAVLSHFISDELIAGLISLAILIPYYLLLSVFRRQLSNKFTFKIKT